MNFIIHLSMLISDSRHFSSHLMEVKQTGRLLLCTWRRQLKKIWILLMISEMNILTSLSLSVKLPVAKPENVFAFGGEVKDEAFVIEKTHCGSNQKFCSLFSYTNKAWMELTAASEEKELGHSTRGILFREHITRWTRRQHGWRWKARW